MAVAGGLGAAKRQVYLSADGRGVHIKYSGVHVCHGAEGAIDVAGVNRRGETIADSVGDFDCFVERLGGYHSRDRAKDLLLRDAHVGSHVGENGGLDVKPARVFAPRQTLAAASERGAVFLLANLDVLHDFLDGVSINHRANVSLRIGAIAYPQGPGALDQLL